jgi:hypothetical protein
MFFHSGVPEFQIETPLNDTFFRHLRDSENFAFKI